jgi:formylglycine-generating enzyme required for sulfatase activity/tRNA A-37 threonylcarbamoyl transferase component Bud32
VAPTIGKYEIVSELGRGAMGVVFLARDPGIDRRVAIKVIHAHAYIGKEEAATLRMRLVREARAAGNLSHPGIVTVYHLDQQDDFLYIVMEFVEGRSLDKYLAAGGNAKTPEDSIRILRQIGEALDYAHQKGIFHRDIKPENVLIDEAGRAKITDFGIARIASQKVTQTGMTMGTPAYMSPEQIRDGAVDGRADQFSLGVVAFEMLTSRQPWEASSNEALILKIATQEPPSAHELNAALPRGCSKVLSKALAKRPERRYATCTKFVNALAETLIPQSLPDTEGPPRRRRFSISIIIGLAFVAIAAAVWILPGIKSRTRVNAKDGLMYAWIPPGAFSMGCSPGDLACQSDEKPAHLVTITKGFWIGQTEVPRAAYRRVTGKFALPPDNLPATPDSWIDAEGYCRAIGLRLPTEAQWEYAARGGNPADRYGTLDAIAWYDRNSGGGNHTVGQKKPLEFPPQPATWRQTWEHPVGQKQPNKYGLYDMLGNVMEWVGDWYDAGYYAVGPSIDPQGPANGKYRVARGGVHNAPADWVRVSARTGGALTDLTGFRCASNVLPNP